ncbi:hypothetical protein QCA50_006484 [Cerrena zonata]|uniref:Major facilitator superfamily (MFS) profile domain-containing protein n=1 Tax=Cerrena zonata TaxID=2478898 RepID=A0AAW0GL79_9APHY
MSSTGIPSQLPQPLVGNAAQEPCFPTPTGSSGIRRLLSSVVSKALPRPIHIPNYVWCALFTAIGGFIFGFDTGSIGPITIMPKFQAQFADKNTGVISPTVQGLIVSSILLTASLASLASGPLSDRISRTRTIAVGAIVFAVGSAIACSANTLAQLFVGRALAGAGEGLFISAVTVYAIEIAPASSRGRLGSVVQLLITIGIASGYFVCYGTSRIDSSLSWRFPLGMQSIVSVILAAGCPFLPHSPRWLRHVGRRAEANVAWERLGVSAADAEKTEESANRERERVQRGSVWEEARAMWEKDVRKRTALGVFVMGMSNASGIDGVLYYAPVLFAQAGLPGTTASFIASGVSGLVNVACTVVVQFFADSWSRRSSMIGGGLVTATCMLTIGSLYATDASNTDAGRWSIIVLIYIFVIGFSCTWAIVTRIICSEIQPMRTRAAATSLGQCANWIINWVIAFTTPLFLAHSSSGPYFLFGTCCLITALVCLAYLPETRGATLEDVDKAFIVSPWKSLMRKRRLSDPGTLVPADVTPAAATASELAASTQEIPIMNDAYEMHVLNEGNDEDIIQYEIDELNEREMELWDTVQMPELTAVFTDVEGLK